MIPYYALIAIILCCILLERSCSTPSAKRRLLFVALIPVYVLLALKSPEVGTDTENYLRSYMMLEGMTFHSVMNDIGHFEPGFLCLLYLLSLWSSDPQTLLLAYGAIVCSSIFVFIEKTSQRKCLCLLFIVTLGLFQFAMTGIRQTIAISILLWSYKFIRDKKMIKFFLMILFAMTFHKSSVLFFPAYFVANVSLTRKNIARMIVGILVIFSFADKLFLSAAEMMEYNYGIEKTGNGYIFFCVVLLITILCVSNRKRLLASNPFNIITLNLNFISMALWCLRLISRTAERVSLYYLPFTCVALEEYLATTPKNNRVVYIPMAIIMSIMLFFYRLYGNPDLNQFKFCF